MIPPSKGPTIGIHQNDSFVKKGSAPSIKDRNILGPRSRAGLIAPLNYKFSMEFTDDKNLPGYTGIRKPNSCGSDTNKKWSHARWTRIFLISSTCKNTHHEHECSRY